MTLVKLPEVFWHGGPEVGGSRIEDSGRESQKPPGFQVPGVRLFLLDPVRLDIGHVYWRQVFTQNGRNCRVPL